MDEKTADTLRTLLVHPAWEIFRASVQAQEKKHYEAATRMLRAGVVPDPGEAKYWQGVFDGVNRLLAKPEKADEWYVKQREKEAEETE